MTKGFTLIELLIVIAIVAVLAVAVVLVLNPAQLLAQGRDSTRISDIGAVNSSIGLWLADVQNPTNAWAATARCTFGTQKPGEGAPGTCTNNVSQVVTGAGWVGPISLAEISGGSPLAQLPLDPKNNTTACAGSPQKCGYAFEAFTSIGQYKLGANMESSKYGGGGGDVENTDGGTVPTWYETGTALTTAW